MSATETSVQLPSRFAGIFVMRSAPKMRPLGVVVYARAGDNPRLNAVDLYSCALPIPTASVFIMALTPERAATECAMPG